MELTFATNAICRFKYFKWLASFNYKTSQAFNCEYQETSKQTKFCDREFFFFVFIVLISDISCRISENEKGLSDEKRRYTQAVDPIVTRKRKYLT